MQVKRITKSGHSYYIPISRDELTALGWKQKTYIQTKIEEGRYVVQRLLSEEALQDVREIASTLGKRART